MNKKIAAIGDIHGCIEELEVLLERLEWLSLDEIWTLGDIVDRGPDSGACVALLREKNISSILGNHEESILKHYKRVALGGPAPSNADKARTVSQLKEPDWQYLMSLPTLHVMDDLNLVLVHGGVFPGIPLYKQPQNVVRAQMIHPNRPGDCRWWGKDSIMHKSGRTEEQNRAEGYHRWYEIYDGEYDVVYGHSVFSQPYIHQNKGCGKTIGIDTGSCFGGMITAGIFDTSRKPFFVSVKSEKVHFERSYRIHQE